MSKVNTFITQIGKELSIEEMIELNHDLCRLIRHQRAHKSFMAGKSFHVGDSVFFQDRRGRTIKGMVEKLNRVNAVVKTEMNVRWRVPFVHLTKTK